jgi:type VI secretion system protein ImpK
MSDSDPFSEFNEDDKTVIRPSPGGRRRQTPASPPVQPMGAGYAETQLQAVEAQGSNPLITGAYSLLSLVPRLRNLPSHSAVNELRQRLIGELKGFENRVLQKGVSRNQVEIAKYLLCSLIDETVLNTPWGNQSGWGHNSLSSELFKKMWGGEEFFQILDRLKQQPAQNLHLLELAYLCLSLGFEGKYRYSKNSPHTLEKERQELYLLIQRLKGDSQRELAVYWQGIRDLRNPLIRHIPLWVFAVVAGALLMLVYMGFAFAVRGSSDRAYGELIGIEQKVKVTLPVEVLPPVEVQPAELSIEERFADILAGEIAQKKVDLVDGSILRIFYAFPSGSATVKKDYRPMLDKITRELENENTRIVVIGHTDNQKIKFSARFKSNWHLSMARAENVASVLNFQGALGGRISFEGMSDKDPIATNDTKAGRALNRRIDIHIR